MTPQRMQLRRTRGWRKPEGTINVARPTRWGNPYTLTDYRECYPEASDNERRRMAVSDFRGLIEGRWDHPCHADVLLELANPGWQP